MKKLLFPLAALFVTSMAANAQSNPKEKISLDTLHATDTKLKKTVIEAKLGDTLFIQASGAIDPGAHIESEDAKPEDYFFGPEGAFDEYSLVRVNDNRYNHPLYLPAMHYGEVVLILRDEKKAEKVLKAYKANKEPISYKDTFKGYHHLPTSTNAEFKDYKMLILTRDDMPYTSRRNVVTLHLDFNDSDRTDDNKGQFVVKVRHHPVLKK